jgi:hypothetical protein
LLTDRSIGRNNRMDQVLLLLLLLLLVMMIQEASM